METVDECSILFNRDDFKDVTGCLKPYGHNDHHVCKTSDDKLIAWEYEYGCQCGCWDSDEYTDVCIIYWEVESIDEKKKQDEK
jgi:hypothetical protein